MLALEWLKYILDHRDFYVYFITNMMEILGGILLIGVETKLCFHFL